jgi:hypothetical protein
VNVACPVPLSVTVPSSVVPFLKDTVPNPGIQLVGYRCFEGHVVRSRLNPKLSAPIEAQSFRTLKGQ